MLGVLTLVAFVAGPILGHAGLPAFSKEWRELVRDRLAECFPGPGPTGVSGTTIGRILGGSKSLASKILVNEDAELSYEYARRLAVACESTVDHLLAVDVLRRFATLEDLEAAIAGDYRTRVDLLIKLYVLNLEARAPAGAPVASAEADDAFVTRWRAEVRRRLALYPAICHDPAISPDVSMVKVARILGKGPKLVTMMLNGPQYLTFESAEALAKHLRVKPEWLLAFEMTAGFGGVADLERRLAHESWPVRGLMIRLYGKLLQSRRCGPDLQASR